MSQLLPNLVVWIHTCPQRLNRIGETTASLDASDIAEISGNICVAGTGSKPYSWPETIDWWMEHWIAMAKLGDWVLRLEDDIIVNPYIGHNLATWPAIRERDFGMGLGFVMDDILRDLGGLEFLPNKVVRSKARSTPGGQAQLMPSRLIPQTIDWVRAHRYTLEGCNIDCPAWFDTGITRALTELGYRTYLHVPSIVRTNAVSDESVASKCHREHHAHRTWLENWKRPEDYEEEFQAEVLLKDYRTRWAVTGDGTIIKCKSPARLDPVASLVTINGRGCAFQSSSLYDSQAEAYAALVRLQG
jgi:hypothetical protein